MSENGVSKAIRSFHAGSLGGPDGFRPQLILDLVNCKETGPKALTALTSFVSILLAGSCPSQIIPIFFGGNPLALEKKYDDIRSIAIVFMSCGLVAKCANSFATPKLAD